MSLKRVDGADGADETLGEKDFLNYERVDGVWTGRTAESPHPRHWEEEAAHSIDPLHPPGQKSSATASIDRGAD
jgi:hypothetical protein